MPSFINLLCLFAMCGYAQTNNSILFVISLLYLSLCTIGCVSFAALKFNSINVVWSGWIAYSLSLIISGTVVYFTSGSPIGLWYFCVTLFCHATCLIAKEKK